MSSVKFFYRDDDELDIIRRVQPGENEELPCERAEARRMQGEAITGMRSSLCLLGALLGRCGYVTMEHPGGCIIGERPIDLHIRALQQMGVEFREEEGLLSAQVKDGKMHGAEITLEFPSVGATENILLAAVKADGGIVRISDGMWCTDRRNRRNGTIGSW